MLSNKLHCTMLPVFLHWIYNAPKVITDRNFKFKICLDQVLRNMGERPWTMTSGKPRLNKNTLKVYLKKKEKRAIYMGWFISISGVYQDLHLITAFAALEAVVRRCSVRKMFLEILQNSKEITCARVSYLIKLRPATLLRKRLWHRCFPLNFAKFLRTPFIIEHLWWLLLLLSHCMCCYAFYYTCSLLKLI